MLQSVELEPAKAAVVASTLDGIVMIDEAGRVLAMNPACESLFGYSAAEAIGQPIAVLIVPKHLRAAHDLGFAAYLGGGEPKVIGRRVETEAAHKDGRIIPVELVVLEINLDGRRIFSATIRDRSEDAAQEEELEQMRHQLELAVAGAQLGIWSYHPRTGISWYSDRVKEIVGLEENFLTDGASFRKLVHPEDRDQLVFDRTDDFPDGPVAREYRIVRPDGEIRWLHSLGSAARDETGAVEAIHGIIFDVTERKQAEDDLESTRHQLELAVEGAQLGVWSMDMEAGTAWVSDRARDLLGLESNVLADVRDVRAHIHPDDWRNIVSPQFADVPDRPGGIQYRLVHPYGTVC
jgi:PAS domain S-box-containing protein